VNCQPTSGKAGGLTEVERLEATKPSGQRRKRGIFVVEGARQAKLRMERHILLPPNHEAGAKKLLAVGLKAL
jgi:hypothetical protein